MPRGGNEPGQSGVYKPPEGGSGVGPEPFSLAPSGEIYIEDGIKKHIQKFSTDEKYINLISN
jgi:hypothetical protein